jgi:NAD(P)H dehydrogenase (quinone)
MYAIAGVTGHTGSVAAETLLAQGKAVRVIVRDAAKGAAWAQKGAEVAVASLDDVAALTRALTGVAGAFLLLPPQASISSPTPLESNRKLAGAIAQAVRAAKLPHVVLLSSVGAQHEKGTGPIQALHHAERELVATGAAVTAVRAAYFQENWGPALGALPSGVLPTFIPAGFRYPQVATRDIGRTVAAALVEGGKPGLQIVELAGPRDYTAQDVAAALATLTGKPVVAQDAPLDAVVPTFTSFGVSQAVGELYREMFAGIASGHIAWQGGAARQVRGTVEVADTLGALLAAPAR